MKLNNTSALLSLTTAACLWGLLGLMLKSGPSDYNPYFWVLVRSGSAFIGCSLLIILLPDTRSSCDHRSIRKTWLILISAAAYGLTILLFTLSLSSLDITVAYALHYTVPLWLFIFSLALRKLDTNNLFSVILVTIGVLFLINGKLDPKGAILAFLSGGTYALSISTLNSLDKKSALSSAALGCLIILIFASFNSPFPKLQDINSTQMLIVGTFGSIIPLTLYSTSISKLKNPFLASLILSLELVVAGISDTIYSNTLADMATMIAYSFILVATIYKPLLRYVTIKYRSKQTVGAICS